jgi:hypothetical protein
MIAIIGFILIVIAAVLKWIAKTGDPLAWLIIGSLLVAFEVAFGWYRAGHTYRRV